MEKPPPPLPPPPPAFGGEPRGLKGGIPLPPRGNPAAAPTGIPAPSRGGGRGPGAPSERFGGGSLRPPRPPMDPPPLLALLLLLLGAARALSTCHRLDLEAAKKKRIEAVRGQILSKLHLSAPPPASETPPRPLPDDVRALYNSTQELLKQRARLRPPPDGPDEYWAKELRRIPMETPGDGEGGAGGAPLWQWGGGGRVTSPCPLKGGVPWGDVPVVCNGGGVPWGDVPVVCNGVGGSHGVTSPCPINGRGSSYGTAVG